MTPTLAASKKANIRGFVNPVDPTPMKEVMMELGVHLFDD